MLKRKNNKRDTSKELETYKLTRSQLRLLGLLPLAFFTAQAVHYCQINQLGHMLWMCNIGNLLLALGLFFEQAILIRVAVLWIIPGLPVWAVYVVPTWGMLLTGSFTYTGLWGVISSTLAHVGGFCVAMFVIREVRVNRLAWLYAFIWYFMVQLLSRLLSPAALNVNVAYSIPAGWERTFSSYWKFWLVLTTLVGVGIWLLGLLLVRLWPPTSAAIEIEGPLASGSSEFKL